MLHHYVVTSLMSVAVLHWWFTSLMHTIDGSRVHCQGPFKGSQDDSQAKEKEKRNRNISATKRCDIYLCLLFVKGMV